MNCCATVALKAVQQFVTPVLDGCNSSTRFRGTKFCATVALGRNCSARSNCTARSGWNRNCCATTALQLLCRPQLLRCLPQFVPRDPTVPRTATVEKSSLYNINKYIISNSKMTDYFNQFKYLFQKFRT